MRDGGPNSRAQLGDRGAELGDVQQMRVATGDQQGDRIAYQPQLRTEIEHKVHRLPLSYVDGQSDVATGYTMSATTIATL